MKLNSFILRVSAAVVAVLGAITSLIAFPQAVSYVKVGTSVYPTQTGISCGPGTSRCQVKTIDRQGNTLSVSTTLYSNSTATTVRLGSGSVVATVTIPINK